jgi:uncharacterized membrane protein (DUF2068 family)
MAHSRSEPVGATPPPQTPLPHPHEALGFLAWIAAYKLIKAAIALSCGFWIWKLGHRDLGVVAHHLIHRFHISPGSWLATTLISRVTHIQPDQMKFAAYLVFLYAALYCVEAVGLLLQKRWAEWLTVVQTSLLIPVEIRHVIHPPRLVASLALLGSVSVVLYLIRRIHHDMLEEQKLKIAGS